MRMKKMLKRGIFLLMSIFLFLSKRIEPFHLHRAFVSPQLQKSFGFDASTEKEIEYLGINHCGLLVNDIQTSVRFYTTILGFTDVTKQYRPKTIPYPGAFVQCGVNQIHLMQLPNPDDNSVRPSYPGRDRHLAISVRNLPELQKRLESYAIPFHLSSSGRKALFCRDSDQNGLEFVEVSDSSSTDPPETT